MATSQIFDHPRCNGSVVIPSSLCCPLLVSFARTWRAEKTLSGEWRGLFEPAKQHLRSRDTGLLQWHVMCADRFDAPPRIVCCESSVTCATAVLSLGEESETIQDTLFQEGDCVGLFI